MRIDDVDVTITMQDGTEVTSTPLFQIKRLTVREATFAIPSFTCEFDTTFMMYGSDFESGELMLESDALGKVTFDVTSITFSPGKITGLLISPEHVFERKSRYLAETLSNSILALDIANFTEGPPFMSCDEISAPETFYQFNETDSECLSRLLDMAGQGTLWALCNDGIHLFPSSVQPNSMVDLSVGKDAILSFDRTRISPTNFKELEGDTSRRNVFYGRYSVPIPRLSLYSHDALSSAIEKRRYKDGWFNCSVIKSYNSEQGIDVGSSVHLSDWEESNLPIPDFITTARTIVLERKNVNYTYEFKNPEAWGTIDG